jgi:hypothetical protein
MVQTSGLTAPTPRVDSAASCAHCVGIVVWDEVHGWLHTDGFYACRSPDTGLPREVLAAPREEQP